MNRYLITGVTGMTGSWLAERLVQEKNGEVFGLTRSLNHSKNIQHLSSSLILLPVDWRDYSSVLQAVRQVKPTHIFHLAGQTSVRASWENSVNTFFYNLVPLYYLLMATVELNLFPLVQITSSSEVYAAPTSSLPLDEEHPLSPSNPYGISKKGMESLALDFFHRHHCRIILQRTFNHTGPRRDVQFVESSFALQFVHMKIGKIPSVLRVGNLDVARDYTDVRDVVDAYLKLSEKGVPGQIYNICSGKLHTLREIIDIYSQITGFSPKIEQDPQLFRKVDTAPLFGDYGKLKTLTNWKPQISFENTLTDLYYFYEKKEVTL